eukprot:4950384-Amphidinium_carterae.1
MEFGRNIQKFRIASFLCNRGQFGSSTSLSIHFHHYVSTRASPFMASRASMSGKAAAKYR